MSLFPHHKQTVQNIKHEFINDRSIIAILLGGSLAHGYAKENSDVDIIFVLTDEEYDRRKKADALLYFNRELCTYPEGYVDGKCVNYQYLQQVKDDGNEPTKYAFKDASFIFCRDDKIRTIVEQIPVFDTATRNEHAKRFFAQILAWKWFFSEGKKHGNLYLMNTAINNFILYSCRLILNHNNLLYPYHKWLLAEVGKAERKPARYLENIKKLQTTRKGKIMDRIYGDIKNMEICEFDETKWSTYFHKDVETTWMVHEPYIADI